MRRYSFPVIILIITGLLVGSCDSITVETVYKNGVVVTSSPIATEIGLKILRKGGNAADAAVAVGFALAVSHPEAGNIGGGGFALYYDSASAKIDALDFREKAPLSATVDMFLDEDSTVIENGSVLGAKAAGVPGTVAGLYYLWKKYGSLNWYQLLEPSVKLADSGFVIDRYLADRITDFSEELKIFDETRSIFFRNGLNFKAGDRFVQSDLAATLQRIALDSLQGFYAGKTADLIVETMEKYGGLISYEDLANYRPVWRTPIGFKFDSLMIYSMPPPSSGGVMLGMILGLLEPFDFQLLSPRDPKYIHLFVEACRLAFAERAVHLGDPDFVSNHIGSLLDSGYLDSRRELIDIHQAGISEDIVSGIPENIPESESTTHFCVADRAGNVISLTYTINTEFGSKLTVGEAGFLLNNEMDDFSIKPGVANTYGLIGGRANAIDSGKRMLSSMSPTIVLKNGKPIFALGSPGGSKIITTVAEAIIDLTRFKLNNVQTVNLPRFHHQWQPDILYLEKNGFDIDVKQALIAMGHNIQEISRYSELMIISISEDGQKTGEADPRRNGNAGGY